MVTLSNSIGQNGNLGPVGAGGVGGDDGVVGGDGGVQVGVVGQRDLDDAVDALAARTARIGRGRVAGVQGDGVGATAGSTWSRSALRRTVPMTVAPPQRASWAASEPTAAEHAVDQDRLAVDRAVGEHGAVGGDAGDARGTRPARR